MGTYIPPARQDLNTTGYQGGGRYGAAAPTGGGAPVRDDGMFNWDKADYDRSNVSRQWAPGTMPHWAGPNDTERPQAWAPGAPLYNTLLNQFVQSQVALSPEIASLRANDALRGIGGALTDQGFDLQEQQLRASTQQSLKELGIRGQGVAQDKAYAQQAKGFADRQYKLTDQEANASFSSNLRGLYSDATARGAVSTQGTRDHRGDLQKQLWNTMVGAGLSKDRDYASANKAMQAADLQAKQIGLDRETYMQGLSFGLSKLGLDRQMSTLDLVEAANSSDAKKAAAAQQIIQQFQSLAQQNPDLLQEWYRTQGTGRGSTGSTEFNIGGGMKVK